MSDETRRGAVIRLEMRFFSACENPFGFPKSPLHFHSVWRCLLLPYSSKWQKTVEAAQGE